MVRGFAVVGDKGVEVSSVAITGLGVGETDEHRGQNDKNKV